MSCFYRIIHRLACGQCSSGALLFATFTLAPPILGDKLLFSGLNLGNILKGGSSGNAFALTIFDWSGSNYPISQRTDDGHPNQDRLEFTRIRFVFDPRRFHL